MQELLDKLRKEKIELSGKIRNLEKFRGTDEWSKLSVSHKCLLDIQLEAMKTYFECLSARTVDIETNKDQQENKPESEQDDIKIIKIIIDN